MVLLLYGPGALFLLSFLSSFLQLAGAGIVNRTIDDSFGDSQTGQLVTYVPATGGVWKDETCIGCLIIADTSQTFKQSYTAATYNPTLGNMSITMQFNGTAIYIFFILANNAGDGITSLTLANFTLDGNTPQLFQHAPDLTTTNLEYNQLVFSKTNLINAQHTLVISTSGVNTNVYVNFDYAIYTHDDDAPLLPLPTPGSSSSSSSSSTTARSSTTSASRASSTAKAATRITSQNVPSSTSALGQDNTPSSNKTTSTGAVVGGVIGGLAVLILLGVFFFWRRRRRMSLEDARSPESGYVPPLMTEVGPSVDQQGPPFSGSVDPFITPSNSQSTHGYKIQSLRSGQGSTAVVSQSSAASPNHDPSSESAYGGYVDPSMSDGHQRRTAGNSIPSSSGIAYYGSSRGALHSVTSGDHLSSPNTDITNLSSSVRNSDNIEDIRQARQNELDQRLRTVQEEMAFLASDMTGEKGGRHQSVRRQRTVTRPSQGEVGRAVVEEGEMTMAEMREQLQLLRDQVGYLREQQRSEWAQGLSDDPPPGYTPASQLRHSLPPIPGQ